ncbi:hypothetical protein RYX36_021055 [Vicia faba]
MLEAAAIPIPLPEELIGEILLRLPVRSLVQFKCVCKSWKILISGSHFIKSHVRISTSDPTITNQQLVFSFRKQPWEIVSYPLKPLFQDPSNPVKPGTFTYSEESFHRIIGSCNGLLCLLDTFPPRCCVVLCNPSLRFISKNSSEPISKDWFMMNYGFGYDQVNDKYKVLLVVRCKKPDYQILTKIYTFGQDDYWKTIPNYPYDDPLLIGKFVSGTLNWIVSHENTIISFDIQKETYMKMLLPQNDSDNNVCKFQELSVLSDCLCVSEYFDSQHFHLVLWMMKEYGVVESFTKFMVIPYDKFIRNQPCSIKLFFISQNGILMVIMDSQLILYNSNTAVALDPLLTMKLGRDHHIYCESLVSLPCYR